MTGRSVVHDTLVVERTYPVSASKVFAAWADADQRRRWHFPGNGEWVLIEMTQDFHVGGVERLRFGPREASNLISDGRFLDIVPNARIVSAGTMHRDGQRISVTLCTVEIGDVGVAGTRVKLTDQSAFLDGSERPRDRQSGWGQVFERLGRHLGADSER